MNRPNILFLFSDQQRWDTVGAYGQPLATRFNLTPNLDAMARQGTLFRHAFTCQPVCGPARACLQSGLYASRSGCLDNGYALPQNITTMAGCMSNAGYQTGYIGKWHLASNDKRGTNPNDAENFRMCAVPPERRGGYRDFWLAADTYEYTSHAHEGFLFDTQGRRVDFEGYRVDRTTDFILDYLRDQYVRRYDRPFFLFASYVEPHQQNNLGRYVGPIGSKQRFADFTMPGDLIGAGGDAATQMPDYLGCCWSLDQNVGRIRAELDLLGLAENTVIIYTADHGSHFCTRQKRYKRSCHEASIHVPLIACGPGFNGGNTVDELVSLIDLPPTVLTAGGAAVPREFQGRAVQPLARGDAAGWRDDMFVQISAGQISRAIRTRRWKYCAIAPGTTKDSPGAERYVEQFLYDLDADPHERDNRVSDPALRDVRAELAVRLKRRMVEAGEREPVIDPAGSVT